jgi:molecular chaperone DnaK (HSP70)
VAQVIGIDLGTTNSALAYAPASPANAERAQIFPIPQLAGPGEVRDEALLPSFAYLPGPGEFPEGSLALPWEQNPALVVGHFAQRRGLENAGRLVSSAKSWLSSTAADRTSPILPWQAPEGVPKISPIDASAAYLRHLRDAWNAAHPDALLEDQDVLVTVPASFDEFARELTLKAAQQAGLGAVTLLEEPQAAFYAWLDANPNWREIVTAGDLILVVDIGGGTTDFSLIAVENREGDLALERIAVGEHLLLGGDNIDLALAHVIAGRLAEKGTRIDNFQLTALWSNCRAGKEKLLEENSTEAKFPVTILGRGSKLIGGSIQADLLRSDIEQVLEGFFPEVAPTEMPQRRRGGVVELGLPYASDAAVTRHLARFLSTATSGEFARPTHVLFNGGVLRAPFVRQRLIGVLSNWIGSPVKALSGEDLMHAVARGSAYYGVARKGKGVRIRGGISRSYYIGVESSRPAVPGIPAPIKALTVAQFGMEEGTSAAVPSRPFGLVVGEPAEFRFFSSAARKTDEPGEVIEDLGGDLEEMPAMQVNLEHETGGLVPVTFEPVITELGQLQLWCLGPQAHRWKLEFNVREQLAPTR